MTTSMGVLMYADPESGRSSSNFPLISNLAASWMLEGKSPLRMAPKDRIEYRQRIDLDHSSSGTKPETTVDLTIFKFLLPDITNGGVAAGPLVEPSLAVGQRARTAWRQWIVQTMFPNSRDQPSLSIGLPTARISRFQTVGSWEP
ncbi:hypothetical protein GE21DRAFT_350 [Neurospora crassa]|uniref:Uncharacterized protein n=1 Tax=Neurospora crassa (strain ATCC 24698 / 74-OR23-1A / CBS 708.71 / DSM 1257 / FGSC 987) TaxID=367110 RepID=A7UVZ7_NEUCR|nr:hypothetical protein NCU10903 [Neurospora crassa OR74A]EDO65469.1 hypothetical protein NCU10903 [Neurospora crassa OR74A]KHE89061.1 hypothetical protein GE21DRAFT_350 [Neurospora crassa]|eukprot:XP_001728560.1 hypothetical protein NCU10903 [Neurospora crassa OR74A]